MTKKQQIDFASLEGYVLLKVFSAYTLVATGPRLVVALLRTHCACEDVDTL